MLVILSKVECLVRQVTLLFTAGSQLHSLAASHVDCEGFWYNYRYLYIRPAELGEEWSRLVRMT